MTPEEAIQVADEVLLAHAGNPLTDIQRMILRESLAGKGYESMEGYAPQHIKNEGMKLWDLLSKALGKKVSKISFRGALEKRWKLGKLIPTPPMLSIYNPQTWVGRKAIIDEYLPKLQGQARILWITGISGIGKTALGECLASQAWKGDPSFQWLYLEILEGQSPEFVSVAADLLAKLGDIDLDPQERNDPKRLMERLLRKLKVSRYWLQVDSLERLLGSKQPTETEFADRHWVTFLQLCLTESNFASRLVLTAQALPSSLAELEDRYPNRWQVITLQGLLAHQPDDQQSNEHLALFVKNGLSVDDSSSSHLRRIGQIYEGHPLVLQVIAKEILAAPFDGNVAKYWERHGNEFEQVARELQAERVSPELYNQALRKRVRRRVELSMKRLPTDAFDLLCRSSVYRRPVPETFWLSLLEEQPSQRRQQAYQILNERAFVEQEGIYQNQFLIRQHNLVRAVAYDLLKADVQMWHQSERQAAHLWLTAYEPAANAPNLETVRGYLEAFDHYCEVEDWETIKTISWTRLNTLTKESLCHQLGIWGHYREQITLHSRLLNIAKKQNDHQDEGIALGNLGNAYHRLGEYERAIENYWQCLRIFREIGAPERTLGTLANLAEVLNFRGDHILSIEYLKHARTMNTEIGNNLRIEATLLCSLGNAHYFLGKDIQALDYYQQHLTVTQKLGDRAAEGRALGNLGNINNKLREFTQAIEHLQKSLVIMREIEDSHGEGLALCGLGTTQANLEQFAESQDNLQSALNIFQSIGAKNDEAYVLKNLAFLNFKAGKINSAQKYCQQALELATELGIPLVAECEALQLELENAKLKMAGEESDGGGF